MKRLLFFGVVAAAGCGDGSAGVDAGPIDLAAKPPIDLAAIDMPRIDLQVQPPPIRMHPPTMLYYYDNYNFGTNFGTSHGCGSPDKDCPASVVNTYFDYANGGDNAVVDCPTYPPDDTHCASMLYIDPNNKFNSGFRGLNTSEDNYAEVYGEDPVSWKNVDPAWPDGWPGLNTVPNGEKAFLHDAANGNAGQVPGNRITGAYGWTPNCALHLSGGASYDCSPILITNPGDPNVIAYYNHYLGFGQQYSGITHRNDLFKMTEDDDMALTIIDKGYTGYTANTNGGMCAPYSADPPVNAGTTYCVAGFLEFTPNDDIDQLRQSQLAFANGIVHVDKKPWRQMFNLGTATQGTHYDLGRQVVSDHMMTSPNVDGVMLEGTLNRPMSGGGAQQPNGVSWESVAFILNTVSKIVNAVHPGQVFLLSTQFDGSGNGSPINLSQRAAAMGIQWLGMDGEQRGVVYFSELSRRGGPMPVDEFAYPFFEENWIVPTSPATSMTAYAGSQASACQPDGPSCHGNWDVRVASTAMTDPASQNLPVRAGIYAREFGMCYFKRAPMGPCAVVMNTSNAAYRPTAQDLPKYVYDHQIQFSGTDDYRIVNGAGTGAVDSKSVTFTVGATAVAPFSTMFLVGK